MQLFINLWRPLLLVSVVTLAVYVGYLRWLEREQVELTAWQEARLLAATVQAVTENAQRDGRHADIVSTLQRMERVTPEMDVILFDLQGRLIYHSAGPPEAQDQEELRALEQMVEQARQDGVGQAFEVRELHGTLASLYVLPLRQDAVSISGYIAIALPLKVVEEGLRKVRSVSVIMILMFVLLNLTMGMLMGRAYIMQPIKQLSENMQRLRRGEQVVLPRQREDELGELQRALAELARELAQAQQQLYDETEAKRRLQITLQQRERLAAVGQVAASLAHEIGSPLQVLIGRAQELRSHLSEDPTGKAKVQALEAQLARIERTMQQTLDMTRSGPSPKAPIAVKPILQEICALLREEAEQRDITLHEALDGPQPRVRANPDQLQQIVFNLLRNALAWTKAGDRITVATYADQMEDILGQMRPALRLEVSDTGAGMSQETISRIFELFFTARTERGGTGLGMPIVRQLVLEHSGQIRVVSHEGAGTCVRIWLPAATEDTPTSSSQAAEA